MIPSIRWPQSRRIVWRETGREIPALVRSIDRTAAGQPPQLDKNARLKGREDVKDLAVDNLIVTRSEGFAQPTNQGPRARCERDCRDGQGFNFRKRARYGRPRKPRTCQPSRQFASIEHPHPAGRDAFERDTSGVG